MASSMPLVVVAATALHFLLSPIPEVSSELYVGSYALANLFMFFYLRCNTFFTLISANFVFLLTSVVVTVVHRVFFSPLTKFPGPKLAAASGLWNANEVRLGRACKTHKALHEKYDSDVVRIGPNELSINNVDALEKLYEGKYLRGTFSTVFNIPGGESVASLRDHKTHSAWRRLLGKGFTKDEMSRHVERLRKHVGKTVQILHKNAGSPVDTVHVMGCLAFDVIQDVAFSYDAGLQDGRGDTAVLEQFDEATKFFALVGHLPHLQQLLRYLPPNGDGKKFAALGERVYSAHQAPSPRPKDDILSHLQTPDRDTGAALPKDILICHILLVLAVGAHSVAVTLTCLLAAMASRPDIQVALARELEGVVDGEGELRVGELGRLRVLDAVVREGLRMFPALQGGTPAIVPEGGVVLKGGEVLPEHAQVWVGQYVLGWQERYFPRANEFLPERWMEQGGGEKGAGAGVNDKRAWIPFGFGAHSCGGRVLALEELKVVVATVVRGFEVRFKEGFDYEGWVAEGIREHFLTTIGERIDLVFVPKEKA